MDFRRLSKLVLEKQRILRDHPELRELQDRIDTELDKAGDNAHNRAAIACSLMLNEWSKIIDIAENWGKK